MIICEELNKEFESKEDLFKALRENATKLIDVKKGNIFKSSDKGGSIKHTPFDSKDETTKVELNLKENFIYPVINTIGFLDSHRDLHVNGIWNKSVKEQQGRISYIADHRLEVTKIIAWKDDVKLLVKDIDWASVGKPYQGQTQALIFEIDKNKLELDSAKKAIDKGWDIENSVRMRYMDVKVCYNSTDKEDAEYKKNYDKYLPQIANKEDFDEIHYFYAVLQAQIVDEGSMVVKGSNSATRVIKDIEPSADTQKQEEQAAELARIALEETEKEKSKLINTKHIY